MGDFRSMLGGNNDGIDANRFAIHIFHGNLGLAIGTQVGQGAVFAYFGQAQSQLVSQVSRHGHVAVGFVGGIAKHHALVTGASLFLGSFAFLGLQSLVHAHRDITGLLVDGNQHAAGVAVKAVFSAVIADIDNGLAGNAGDVHIALGGNFTKDMDLAGGHNGFAGYTTLGVFLEDGVQDSIGNLVGDFIRMAFGYGFRGK